VPNLERYDQLLEKTLLTKSSSEIIRSSRKTLHRFCDCLEKVLDGDDSCFVSDCAGAYLALRVLQLHAEELHGEGAVKQELEKKAQSLYEAEVRG
jgi:hypothetical protein